MTRPRDPRNLWRRKHSAPAPPAPPEPPAAPAEETPAYLIQDGLDGTNMRRVISFLLGPADNAVDIGAHAGSLTAEMVRVAPEGKHVALEPLPHLAQQLREQFPTVEVHELAASNRSGSTSFSHVRAAEGWSGLMYRPLPGGAEGDPIEITVQLRPLDELLDRERPIKLMKIDVEGAEQQVFEGAMETLRTHRPTLIFEHGVGSANMYGTHPDDIYALLTGDLGYRIFDLDGNGPYPLEEFKRCFWSAERVNWVAHP
jgi:FkbM family methyltransferase